VKPTATLFNRPKSEFITSAEITSPSLKVRGIASDALIASGVERAVAIAPIKTYFVADLLIC
jgi:hypothetical protein